ncbi:protein SYM1-like [Tasmannia lanceolata]|uniref:protein SYM1-like n=1 Tax=Tasmannia lanceolata TaxID=3420 RepID=UPI00406401D1
MRGSFVRTGGRHCLQSLFESRTILDPSPFFSSSSYSRALTKPHWRTYVRSPLLFKNHGQSNISSSSFSSSLSLSFNKGFVNWYIGMVESRPVLVKSVTAGLIFMAADLSSQMITLTSSDSMDLIRTLRMAGYGMLILGPSLHMWFNFISKALPKRDVLNILKKLFLGQTTYGPIMTAIFFSMNAGLQGENGSEIVTRLKRDMIPTMISGLMYWPICDFITFKFIPVHLQPLICNSFSFFWTIYLTYMASLKNTSMDENPTD